MSPDVDPVIEQIKSETNFITKAKLLRFLTVDKEIKIKDISLRLSMKESYVCHILRLNKLNDMIVDGYYSKLISISHLFIISRLHTPEDMMKAYEKVLSENMTVSQTEELVREMLYQTKTVGSHIPKTEIGEAAAKLETQVPGAKLKIVQTRVKSRIVVELKGSLAETTPSLKTLLKKLIA